LSEDLPFRRPNENERLLSAILIEVGRHHVSDLNTQAFGHLVN
jgi:hypothetical protein